MALQDDGGDDPKVDQFEKLKEFQNSYLLRLYQKIFGLHSVRKERNLGGGVILSSARLDACIISVAFCFAE